MKIFPEDLTTIQFLGILGAVAVTTGGAIWGVAQKVQSDELQGFKTAQELHLKDAIASLKTYAEAAKLTTADHAKLASMEKQIPDLIKANTELKARLDGVTGERDNLRATVNEILKKNTEVSIPPGQARSILPNLVIGVVTIYSSWIEVTVNGSKRQMNPGEALDFKVGGKPGTAILTKIAPDAVTFTVDKPE